MARKKKIVVDNATSASTTGLYGAAVGTAFESEVEEESEPQRLANIFMSLISESERERMRDLAKMLALTPLKK